MSVEQQFKDRYGDTISVSADCGYVYVTVEVAGPSNQVELDPSVAKQVAKAILQGTPITEPAPTPSGDRVADALERIADALDRPALIVNQYVCDGVPADTEPEAQIDPQTVELEDVECDSTVTFTYQGEHDTYPRQRRVRVDDVDIYADQPMLMGVDLDVEAEDGDGYRQFRADRIKSPIMVVADA